MQSLSYESRCAFASETQTKLISQFGPTPKTIIHRYHLNQSLTNAADGSTFVADKSVTALRLYHLQINNLRNSDQSYVEFDGYRVTYKKAKTNTQQPNYQPITHTPSTHQHQNRHHHDQPANSTSANHRSLS